MVFEWHVLFLVFFVVCIAIHNILDRKYYNTFLLSLFSILSLFFMLVCDDFHLYQVICKLVLLSFFMYFMMLFTGFLKRISGFEANFEREFVLGLILFVLLLDKVNGTLQVLRPSMFVGVCLFLVFRYLYVYCEPSIYSFLEEEMPKQLVWTSRYIAQALFFLFNLTVLLYCLNCVYLFRLYSQEFVKLSQLIIGVLLAPYAIFFLEKLSDKFVHNINLSNVDRVATLKGFFQIIVKIFYGFTLICLVFGVAWLSTFFTTFAFLAFAFQDFFRSFTNGLWVLFEDSVNIGEFVEVGGVSGKVESITLRIITLRDFEGSLFIVPFDKVSVIRNRGKDYVYVVFKISIMPGVEVDRVLELIKKAFENLKNNIENEHLKPNFLENIEVIGLTSVSSVGMIFEARLKIRPLNTRMIKAAYYKELKALFDAENINFGYEYWLVTNKRINSSKRA